MYLLKVLSRLKKLTSALSKQLDQLMMKVPEQRKKSLLLVNQKPSLLKRVEVKVKRDRVRVSLGDVVSNSEKTSSMGMLVEKCDLHGDYWKVLHKGKLEVWWEPNIISLSPGKKNE